jgi:hypothetical protein
LQLHGTIRSFKDAYTVRGNLFKKAAKSETLNTMLHISSNIKIPIRVFNKIVKPKVLKWTLGMIDDKTATVRRDTVYMKYDETNQTDVKIKREEVIKAYLYGSRIVPVSDIDKQSMKYKSGVEGLLFIGCTAKDSVPRNRLMGSRTDIVLARHNDHIGNHMLQSLIQAMYENDTVGIASRVFANSSVAHMGALYPRVTDESRVSFSTSVSEWGQEWKHL